MLNTAYAERGADIALNNYLDEYAQGAEDTQSRIDNAEAEIAEEIRCMKIDLYADGRECDCCENIIHGAGHIKGYFDAWTDTITYHFYCDECAHLAE